MQLAMNDNFVWIATDDTESDYLEYRQLKDEKIIKADDSEVECFEYTVLNWYNWNTLVCRTKWIYDLYRVYDGDKLVLESEDEVIEIPDYWFRYWFQVYGYDRLWDNRLIRLAEWTHRVDLPLREKSDYKLSVVVPLYKAEKFMCRTIDSILSSSLDSIELILVNDGSPDNSLQIAKRYADNYGCVKVIDKANSWVSDSRNIWMDIAAGEYLAFCDADDIIHPYMYEILFNACKKENSDLALSRILIRTQPNVKEWNVNVEEDRVYDFEGLMKSKKTKDNLYFVWVWNKIVKTESARKVRFISWLNVYEDIAYTWSLYSYVDKFVYCHDAIYTWEQRKRNTQWTLSTRSKQKDYKKLWREYIQWAFFPFYNKSWNHLERHDYTHLCRISKAYAQALQAPELKAIFDPELKRLINDNKLYNNKLIMEDKELWPLVSRLR